MTQFLNHVDHAVWLSEPGTFDQHREELELLAGVSLEGPHLLDDLACKIVFSASAGLALVTPTDDPAPTGSIGEHLRTRLAERGEGLLAVCIGVADLTTALTEARSRGLAPSEPQDWALGRPWASAVDSAAVAVVGSVLDTVFYLGEIHYKPGVVTTQADTPGYHQNVNHIDHVAWLTTAELFAEHRAQLEQLSGVPLYDPADDEGEIQVSLSWTSGLELLAPPAQAAADDWLSSMLLADLERQGPAHQAAIFGVPDMGVARDRATAAGHQISPLIDPLNDPHQDPSWRDKTGVFFETVAGHFMGAQFVFGEITYRDDVFVVKD
ncbi:hypothetical protein [Nocardioides sp. cx-173]|uniref:hypothetical protein n=1 Tax=Nocardioides sp. cx-173 TaxID=2898796 RepID=UPI001E582C56|nr:hypothetical protein [Nocardioides sp. cx-173]MCD4524254.1 hypothetical protein [Nocardioides sp. cx-173]UGB41646.1 hypothetical protein LQ940_20105 [Nocardioides sp. cx-173]